MWTRFLTKTRRLVTSANQRGLLDTNVIIDIENIDVDLLPEQMLISAMTLAELAAGPHATNDSAERARRQDRLQRAETTFESLSFDKAAARAYGRIYALELAGGRKVRGGRAIDLLIAAIALSEGLPLYTRNPADFQNVASIVDIVAL
jgi:predicted nucleic acid-binding protein